VVLADMPFSLKQLFVVPEELQVMPESQSTKFSQNRGLVLG
jgi:hypothetical protein